MLILAKKKQLQLKRILYDAAYGIWGAYERISTVGDVTNTGTYIWNNAKEGQFTHAIPTFVQWSATEK